MNEKRNLSRREFLKYAGGAVAAAGTITWAGKILLPEAASAQALTPHLYLAGTDGWMYLPPTPQIIRPSSVAGGAPLHPDSAAPDPFTTYIFGFRNITGMSETQKLGQKFKAQHNAPLFWVNQYDEVFNDVDFRVQITNLGLELRPDLFDAHTLHWHGFRNVIPFFDGEPSGSVGIPTGRNFNYIYRPREPGTYMFHCHVEDVEHVQMGMTGLVFVRPLQDGTSVGGYTKFMYNDADTTTPGSTGFDREFAMFLSEVWTDSHWADAHVQLPEWSDYKADFAMLNGRVYPDTLLPNSPINAANSTSWLDVETDANGDLMTNPGLEHLQYNPHSSLVNCNAGERVALRFANLGFKEQAMTLAGIQMRVVGRDATHMRGRDGTDTSYETDTINIGPGESFDVVFTAPSFSGGSGSSGRGYDTYMLYNRNYVGSNNLAPGGFGGQATEVHVYPGTTVPAQQYPNDLGI